MLLINRDKHITLWVCKSIHLYISVFNKQWTSGERFVTHVETGNTCSCTGRMKYKFLYVNNYGNGSGKYLKFLVQLSCHKQLQTVLLDVIHRNWGLDFLHLWFLMTSPYWYKSQHVEKSKKLKSLPQLSVFANFCCYLSMYVLHISSIEKMVSHIAVGC